MIDIKSFIYGWVSCGVGVIIGKMLKLKEKRMCDCLNNVQKVEVLNLSENDIVVVTMKDMNKLPKAEAEEFMKELQARLKSKLFPNNQVLILADNTSIQVIKKV